MEPTKRAQSAAARKVTTDKQKAASDELKAAYKDLSSNLAFQDLVKKIASFASYHTKVAKDRTGFENVSVTKADGSPTIEQRQVKLTQDEQVAELQRAAGIEEISAYIDRQMA